MQFIDLAAQYESLKDSIDRRIWNVLQHGGFIMGPEVRELEEQLAEYVGVRHAIACANGTDALQLALMSLEIGPGDAVFTTPFTFFATAEVISLVGATPVFVDIDPDTFNLNPDRLEDAIKEISSGSSLTPRAIIAVDLFGLPASYERLEAIAERYQLALVEDAAQGFGGVHRGKRAGGFGAIGTTSFFPAKPLGCYGDGGAVFTNDETLADIVRSLRIHGKGHDKYDNVRIGLNSRLDTIQAAVLLEKLSVFPRELDARQQVAESYSKKLTGLLKTPEVPDGFSSSWAQYTVRISADRRNAVLDALKANHVPTAVYYVKPLHLQTAFKDRDHVAMPCPESENASSTVFSLPMHPYLGTEDIDYVTSSIASALEATECRS